MSTARAEKLGPALGPFISHILHSSLARSDEWCLTQLDARNYSTNEFLIQPINALKAGKAYEYANI
jgi:hypothetical protein